MKYNIFDEEVSVYYKYHRLETNTQYTIEVYNDNNEPFDFELKILGNNINFHITEIKNIKNSFEIPFLIPDNENILN